MQCLTCRLPAKLQEKTTDKVFCEPVCQQIYYINGPLAGLTRDAKWSVLKNFSPEELFDTYLLKYATELDIEVMGTFTDAFLKFYYENNRELVDEYLLEEEENKEYFEKQHVRYGFLKRYTKIIFPINKKYEFIKTLSLYQEFLTDPDIHDTILLYIKNGWVDPKNVDGLLTFENSNINLLKYILDYTIKDEFDHYLHIIHQYQKFNLSYFIVLQYAIKYKLDINLFLVKYINGKYLNDFLKEILKLKRFGTIRESRIYIQDVTLETLKLVHSHEEMFLTMPNFDTDRFCEIDKILYMYSVYRDHTLDYLYEKLDETNVNQLKSIGKFGFTKAEGFYANIGRLLELGCVNLDEIDQMISYLRTINRVYVYENALEVLERINPSKLKKVKVLK